MAFPVFVEHGTIVTDGLISRCIMIDYHEEEELIKEIKNHLEKLGGDAFQNCLKGIALFRISLTLFQYIQ